MKKLALILIIAGLSTLMSLGITSAKVKEGWGAIQGTYEMVATGSCLHSTLGFIEDATGTVLGPPFIPKPGSIVWGATTMAEATWVFYPDGTGYFTGLNNPIDFPPGSPGPPPTGPSWGPRARQGGIGNDIKFHLSGSDIIIELYAPGTDTKIGELVGQVSLDKKTLIIPSANVVYNFTGFEPPTSALYWAVCNTARVLIRVGNVP
jgi:hypothetical protein